MAKKPSRANAKPTPDIIALLAAARRVVNLDADDDTSSDELWNAIADLGTEADKFPTLPAPGATAKSKKLRPGDKANFTTLERAFSTGELALVSAVRKVDQAQVALVCAMQPNEDATITPIPLAVMVEGNPFELFEDPTVV